MDAKAPLLRACALLGALLAGSAWTHAPGPPAAPPDSVEQLRPVPRLALSSLEGRSVADALRAWGWNGRSGRALLHQTLVAARWGDPASAVRLQASFLANGGEGIAASVGDVQGASNIEASPTRRVYEVWLETGVGGGDGSLRVGLYDLNSEFYVTGPAALFLNASHGIGSEFGLTGEAGPSVYPLTSLAVRLDVPVGAASRWRTAVLDGVPGIPGRPDAWGIALSRDEGALIVSEVERAWSGGSVRVVAGGWVYTASFPELGTEVERRSWGNGGLYLLAEGDLAGCGDGEGCLQGFARLGKAAARFNTVATGAGGGVVYRSSPDGWAVGAGITHAGPGGPYRRAMRLGAHEVNWELTGLVPLGRHLAVQPDVQFVHDPGMAAGYSHAVVAGLRVGFTLAR